MERNNKNNAYTFLRTLCRFRKINTNNEIVKKQIKEAIYNENLTEDYIEQIMLKKTITQNGFNK